MPLVEHRRALCTAGLLALLAAGLYLLTLPANRSEAEDAYAYAYAVENGSLIESLHPHHVLYGPLNMGLFRALRAVHPSLRAFTVMGGVSLACSALCVGLFYLICRTAGGMSGVAAIIPPAGLGVSYGFWRYAGEVEIYAPASLAIAMLFLLASGVGVSRRSAWAQGAWAGLSVLLHVMVAAPAIGITMLLFRRGGPRAALRYLLGAVIVVMLGYTIMTSVLLSRGTPPSLLTAGHSAASRMHTARAIPRALLKGGVGLSQSLVSGNFLFAYDPFNRAMRNMFPTRQLDEERVMGAHTPAASRVAAPFTLIVLLLMAGGAIVIACSRKAATRGPPAQHPAPAVFQDLGYAALLTAAIHALTVLIVEPGNPEMWLMCLVPLWLCGTVFIIQPLWSEGHRRLVAGLVLALAAHNYLGGMLVVSRAEGDYNHRKAQWVIEHAGEDSTIVTADSQVFVRYLRYLAAATVWDITDETSGELTRRWKEARSRGAPLFVMGDVFRPPEYLQHASPERYAAVTDFGREIHSNVVSVHHDEFGGVAVWRPRDGQPGVRSGP